MNKQKLESVMKLFGLNGNDMAEMLGIARNTFSNKINERKGAEFNKSEMTIMKEKLHLDVQQMDEIFFSKEVS